VEIGVLVIVELCSIDWIAGVQVKMMSETERARTDEKRMKRCIYSDWTLREKSLEPEMVSRKQNTDFREHCK
jgi:hypothetical protein